MGRKKKYKDQYNARQIEITTKLGDILMEMISNNKVIDLTAIDRINEVEYLLAILLNNEFEFSNKDVESNFGADVIIAMKIDIIENGNLRYWGKINWLSKPQSHSCFRSFQDPFLGYLKLENGRMELVKAMFGDYNKNDLDGSNWLNEEIDWMYQI